MHETIIANMVLKDLQKHKGIKSAKIEVGELAEVTAHELAEALSAMVKYNVEVSEKKATVRCACGHVGHPEILERQHHFVAFACPKCGEVPEIVDGNEIRIKEVKVRK